MKYIAAISVAFLVTASAGFQPAKAANALGTAATGSQITDITRDVQGWHDAKHPDCLFGRVLGASLVKRDGDSVTENWTVEACNKKQFTYSVYIIFQGGGIVDMVSNAN